MKLFTLTRSILLCAIATTSVQVNANAPEIYLNKNLGFNIEGFNYKQSEYPCDLNQVLVDNLITRSQQKGIAMEATGSANKILNSTLPVLAIDVEELVLNEKFRFGSKAKSNLPRVGVTVALIKGKDEKNIITAKHTCAIATLNEFTPSSNIMDLGTTTTVCKATQKCLRDLSKDIVQWVEQVK